VCVCDRLVLHSPSAEQIKEIASGRASLDALTRKYIHEC
jgi:hypothetical protein